MEALVGIVLLMTTASLTHLIVSRRRRARLHAWRLAAKGAGLEAIEESEGGFFVGASLEGRSGKLRVKVETPQRGQHNAGTRIVITDFGHGAGDLWLRREGLATAVEKRLIGEREIEIGDSTFDDEYYVQGEAALAMALLDPETRPRLARFLRGQIRQDGDEAEARTALADGVLTLELEEGFFSESFEKLTAALSSALDIGRRLVPPHDLPARIAGNLRREAQAGVRLRSLLLLAREFPDHPATRQALLAGREDPSEEVRLRAAIALGREGRATLVDLVDAVRTPDSIAARAVSALGDVLSPDLAEVALRRALGETGHSETARACLEALGRRGQSEAEGLMIEALRSNDPNVQEAAARALGRAGSAGAVAALRDAMPPRGDLLRSVGRQAIAEIQARLQGAAPGQLSLAGGEVGQLSLAGGEAGDLSLAGEASQPTADPSGPGETAIPRDDRVRE